ncbi:APC amino acid permease [Globomyces pollinis-pini]|nr:APC amino acid permease [Globomyces pollinis-pini]
MKPWPHLNTDTMDDIRVYKGWVLLFQRKKSFYMADDTIKNDEVILARLGYQQELKRELTSFSNFAISFTIISILTGVNSLFSFGLRYGGPVVLVWGWTLVFSFSLMVALSMAEICSAYPTSGGLYFWAAQLSTPQHAPFWSWLTGWFNLIGQVATTTGITFGLATLILNVYTLGNPDFVAVAWHNFVLFVIIMLIIGALNSFANKVVKILCDVSVWWHIFGIFIICLAVLIGAPQKRDAGFVFTTFHEDVTAGLPSPVYTFAIGLLTAQFTFTGYDASAHMSEETQNASLAGPIGIVMSVVISFFFGLFYIICLLFAMPADVESVISGGLVVIFDYAVGKTGSILLSVIVMVAMFFCGMSSLTSNSRMMYAFSRDNALPFSNIWHSINQDTKIPTNSVWLGVALSIILAVPALLSPTQPLSKGIPIAFSAVTSVSVIGLYISYVIPVFLRHTTSSESFVSGPFHLGGFSKVVGWVSILWVFLITIIFVLPTSLPSDANTESFTWLSNMNYAGPMVIICVLIFMGWWVVDARKWFKGPNVVAIDKVVVPAGSTATVNA